MPASALAQTFTQHLAQGNKAGAHGALYEALDGALTNSGKVSAMEQAAQALELAQLRSRLGEPVAREQSALWNKLAFKTLNRFVPQDSPAAAFARLNTEQVLTLVDVATHVPASAGSKLRLQYELADHMVHNPVQTLDVLVLRPGMLQAVEPHSAALREAVCDLTRWPAMQVRAAALREQAAHQNINTPAWLGRVGAAPLTTPLPARQRVGGLKPRPLYAIPSAR